RITISGEILDILRYGENPHQRAAAYRLAGSPHGIASAEQLQGRELSFINFLDLDAAYRLATAFEQPAACIVKHTSPCGVAIGADIDEAYKLAFECDPRSAFGGIIGLNRPLTAGIADRIVDFYKSGAFMECIVAPEFDEDALAKLQKGRRATIRLLR